MLSQLFAKKFLEEEVLPQHEEHQVLSKFLNSSSTVPVQTQVTAPVTTMTNPDKPDKPIMGGLRNFGTYEDAWTGGKPNIDWTGLDTSSPKMSNPNQLRSYNIKARSAFNARRNGLYSDEPTRRFKSGGNLDYFCQNLRTAFLDNGMDTVCYRKDSLTIGGTEKMVDVLGRYHRFNRHAMGI